MSALIAARYLVRAPDLRKGADIDVLDVSAGDADGNDIFRLAGGGAGVTTNTTRVVDHFGPLDTGRLCRSWFNHLWLKLEPRIYHG